MHRESFIAQYRKFWIGRRMSGCLKFFHSVVSVSRLRVMFWMAYLVISRFMSVVLLYGVFWWSRSARYAIRWVSVVSLIPWRWKFVGMSRSMKSGWSFRAP